MTSEPIADRLARIRAAQATRPPLTAAQLAEALDAVFIAHADHPWYRVGRCVYCGPCGARLYQGAVPPDHPIYTPPRQALPSDDMRRKWGMDERSSRRREVTDGE
jgi:hypothetical protein